MTLHPIFADALARFAPPAEPVAFVAPVHRSAPYPLIARGFHVVHVVHVGSDRILPSGTFSLAEVEAKYPDADAVEHSDRWGVQRYPFGPWDLFATEAEARAALAEEA